MSVPGRDLKKGAVKLSGESFFEKQYNTLPLEECCGVHEHSCDGYNGGEMPDEDKMNALAELYKMFGDTTRVKILYVLLKGEMCVCDIAELLQISQSAISHQLRILKASQLVKNRRSGKAVFYSLADAHVITILAQGMQHICE